MKKTNYLLRNLLFLSIIIFGYIPAFSTNNPPPQWLTVNNLTQNQLRQIALAIINSHNANAVIQGKANQHQQANLAGGHPQSYFELNNYTVANFQQLLTDVVNNGGNATFQNDPNHLSYKYIWTIPINSLVNYNAIHTGTPAIPGRIGTYVIGPHVGPTRKVKVIFSLVHGGVCEKLP